MPKTKMTKAIEMEARDAGHAAYMQAFEEKKGQAEAEKAKDAAIKRVLKKHGASAGYWKGLM